jgi:hypothetical protein
MGHRFSLVFRDHFHVVTQGRRGVSVAHLALRVFDGTMHLEEPANPFDPKARRRPRWGAAVLGTLILIALALAAYFNISAMAS